MCVFCPSLTTGRPSVACPHYGVPVMSCACEAALGIAGTRLVDKKAHLEGKTAGSLAVRRAAPLPLPPPPAREHCSGSWEKKKGLDCCSFSLCASLSIEQSSLCCLCWVGRLASLVIRVKWPAYDVRVNFKFACVALCLFMCSLQLSFHRKIFFPILGRL